MSSIKERIQNDFKYHQCSVGAQNAMADMRVAFHNMAGCIDALVLSPREKHLALTKLEEVMFWTNAGIARQSKPEVLDESQIDSPAQQT